MTEFASKQPPYPCNCCGFLTLTDPAIGSYEICPVCFWEDDPVQDQDDPLFAGGANAISLASARENYILFGACEPRFIDRVRSPSIGEVPRPTVIAGLESGKRRAAIFTIKAVLLGIVRGMLSGHIATLDGCSAIAAVASPLNDSDCAETLRTFEVVAGEIDDLPVGETRQLCSPDVLRVKDAESAAYEHRVRSVVQNACHQLETYLKDRPC